MCQQSPLLNNKHTILIYIFIYFHCSSFKLLIWSYCVFEDIPISRHVNVKIIKLLNKLIPFLQLHEIIKPYDLNTYFHRVNCPFVPIYRVLSYVLLLWYQDNRQKYNKPLIQKGYLTLKSYQKKLCYQSPLTLIIYSTSPTGPSFWSCTARIKEQFHKDKMYSISLDNLYPFSMH